MKKLSVLLVFLFMASCSVYSVKPPEPKSQYPATIRVVVTGLQSRALFVDDVVWVKLYKGTFPTSDSPIATERMTPDNALINYRIEGNQVYTMHFESVAPIMGGIKKCQVSKQLKLEKNQKIKLLFKIEGGYCRVAAERL